MSTTCAKCPTPVAPERLTKRVVLAGRFAHGATVAERFRALGWEVRAVPARDVHAAVLETDPHALVLPETAGDESGYLACAKLRLALPELKVALVGAERTGCRERFAAFVGAGFVAEADGVGALVATVA